MLCCLLLLGSIACKSDDEETVLPEIPVFGDISLVNQAQVDSFGNLNFSSVEGRLRIQPTFTQTGEPITDLSALSSLRKVDSLDIVGTRELSSLSGLENISEIGSLQIGFIDELTNLNGLSGLRKLNELRLVTMGMLEDLSGLGGIEEGPTTLLMSNCTVVSDLSVLSMLPTSMDFFSLENMPNLTRLDAVGHIEFIDWLSIRRTEIQNLEGFSSIQAINRYLGIRDNSRIESLNGLTSLSSLNGVISISNNIALTDISALAGLVQVGSLSFRDNLNLYDYSPLSSITTVTDGIWLRGSNAIYEGFNNIRSVGGNIQIEDNGAIQGLTFLSSLENLGQSLSISQCGALQSLVGLDNLKAINGGLYLTLNNSLRNLDGLSSVEHINGLLWLRNNDALENLDAMSNLDFLAEGVNILGNDALTDFCGLKNLLQDGRMGGSYTVGNNGFDPSRQDILNDNCSQ